MSQAASVNSATLKSIKANPNLNQDRESKIEMIRSQIAENKYDSDQAKLDIAVSRLLADLAR